MNRNRNLNKNQIDHKIFYVLCLCSFECTECLYVYNIYISNVCCYHLTCKASHQHKKATIYSATGQRGQRSDRVCFFVFEIQHSRIFLCSFFLTFFGGFSVNYWVECSWILIWFDCLLGSL